MNYMITDPMKILVFSFISFSMRQHIFMCYNVPRLYIITLKKFLIGVDIEMKRNPFKLLLVSTVYI